MEDDIKEIRMMFTDESGALHSCDLVFEEDVPYAVWAACPEKEHWVKLAKQHLQPVNNFMGREFVHYLYQQPIQFKKQQS